MPSPLRLDVHAPIDLRFGTTDVRLEPLSEPGQAPDWDALAQRWSASHPGDDAIPSRDLDEDPVLHLPVLWNRLRTETFEPRAITPWLQAATRGLIKSFDGDSSDPEEQAEARLRWTNHLMTQETTIALLLDHGAVPDPYTVSQVVANGNPRLLQRVLDAGANRLDWSSEGLSATYQKVAQNVMPVPRHMRAAAARLAYTVSPLIAAMYHRDQSGSVTMARMMLDAGTPAELVDPVNGNHALHWAAAFGVAPIVALLLERGASPHVRNQQGHTPVHLAAHGGHPGVIDVLHAHGADLNAVAPDLTRNREVLVVQAAPMGQAVVLGQPAPEDLGLEWDPRDVHARAPAGPFHDTPVMQAAFYGATRALNRLLDLGAEPCPPLDPAQPDGPCDERALKLLRNALRNSQDSGNASHALEVDAVLKRVEGALLRRLVRSDAGGEPTMARPVRRL